MHLIRALVLSTARSTFGIAVDEETVQEVDKLVAECDELGTNRSEIVETILTAFIQPDSDHAKQVRDVVIRESKGTL